MSPAIQERLRPHFNKVANCLYITLSHVALGCEDDRLKPIVSVLNAFALTDIHYLGENLGIAELQEDDREAMYIQVLHQL